MNGAPERSPAPRSAGVAAALSELAALTAAVVRFGRWRLAGLIVLVMAVSVIEGFGLALLAPLAAVVFATEASPSGLIAASEAVFDRLGLDTQAERLWSIGAVYAGLLTLRAVAIAVKETRVTAFQLDFIKTTRVDVYGALAAAPWPVLARLDRSEVLSALSEHLNRAQSGVGFLFRAALSGVQLIVLLLVAFALSPPTTALLLGLGAAVAAIAAARLAASRDLGAAASETARRMMVETGAFLSGLKAAKAAGREPAFVDRFARSASQARQVALRFVIQQVSLRRIIEFAVAVGAGVVLVTGATRGWAEPEVLVAVAALFARAAPQFQQIAGGLQMAVNAAPAYTAAQRIRRRLAVGAPAPVPADGPSPSGPVTFARVEVAFDDGEDAPAALRVDDLTLPQTGLVVVTGPSGAGKSTFAETLTGLRAPRAGEIKVGGETPSPARLGAWRRAIAFLPQEPFLFNASVRENIAWPAETMSDDAVWAALSRVGATDIVAGLPSGLDHPLGEAGLRLSGGERQRLCLARLLSQDARVYVLDEPTANLDAKSEAAILSELERLSQGALVVLISHSADVKAKISARIDVVDGVAQWAGASVRTSS